MKGKNETSGYTQRERVTLKLIDIYRERNDNNETSEYIEIQGG